MEPHVVFLPLPVHGHLKPLLTLAELISHAGLRVTFVNTHHNQARLESSIDLAAFCDRHPKFKFVSLSDGLPPDFPRSDARSFFDLMRSVRAVFKPGFRELLVGLVDGGNGESKKQQQPPPPTCVIADVFMSFGVDLAAEFRIPVISFSAVSAGIIWTLDSIPRLVKEGHLPFKGDDMDEAVTFIPGLEGFLKRRDLPGPGKVHKQLENFKQDLDVELDEMSTTLRASDHGFIVNTVQGLEAPALANFSSLCPKVYSVGPLHTLLEIKAHGPDGSSSSNTVSPSSTGVLGEQDRSCLAWLDTKPTRSVVYVSFGSLLGLDPEETLELWHGLVNSGKPFLWVASVDVAKAPEELQIATKERGCIVDWAPQVEALAHPSIGCFMTHCGWNSVLESVVLGVPMICSPRWADQFLQRRLVTDAWRVGLDMDGTCDRVGVEKMVRELMEEKREELVVSMDEVSRKARESVKEGGSSYGQLNMLVQDLRSMASTSQMK